MIVIYKNPYAKPTNVFIKDEVETILSNFPTILFIDYDSPCNIFLYDRTIFKIKSVAKKIAKLVVRYSGNDRIKYTIQNQSICSGQPRYNICFYYQK